jgi:DNA polymerase III subunit epsilon
VRTRIYAIVALAVAAAIGAVVRSRRRGRERPAPVPVAPPRGDHDGWHQVALASLDFETTGVDPRTDRVLSYALLGDRGTDVAGLIDPGVPIPPGSAEVHGLTAEMLVDAQSSETGIAVVLDWVQDLVDRGVGLVVFNAAYDLTMLRAEAARAGLPQPDWDRLLVVDPYVLAWAVERRKRGPRRLTDVAAFYDVRLDNAHDAAADARAARDVAHEIGLRYPQVASASLDELVRRQKAWFAERVEDWNAYALTAGRRLDDPHGWPLGVALVH